MNVLEAMMNRHTTRAFAGKRVEKEKVETLLRAAMQVPSAAKQRAWEFLVVEKKETLEKLSGMDEFSLPAKNAPLCILVLCNEKYLKQPLYWQQELAAAVQSILLGAVELKLGTVWMGIAPKEERMAYIRDLFKLPAGVKAFAAVAVGYPENESVPEDRFNPERVHYEIY